MTGSIIDEFDSSNMEGDEMEGESCITRSIIDDRHSFDLVKWRMKVVLLEVSIINFILRIFNEIKRKVEVVLLEVSLVKFILLIWSNGR